MATAIAEKAETMVTRGVINSRMKDFYDLMILSQEFDFDGSNLSEAIKATFERRGTPIPAGVPTALTDEFSNDRIKQNQWTAFLIRNGLTDSAPDLSSVIRDLRAFLLAPLHAAAERQALQKSWKPGGPWA
jgi:hypothetical protein